MLTTMPINFVTGPRSRIGSPPEKNVVGLVIDFVPHPAVGIKKYPHMPPAAVD